MIPNKTQTININGDISNDLIGNLFNVFGNILPDTQKVVININSGGGAVPSAVTAYNMIKALPYQVETHNMGEVSSAAILIYLAGKIRTTEPVFKFMFHPFMIGGQGPMSYASVMEKLKILESDLKNYAAIVAKEIPAFCRDYDIDDVLKNQTVIVSDPDEAQRLGILAPAP